jgi:HAD superfamily hydrolase (TIGR01490 family)
LIAFFDLDHTLLSADSDVLWCEFLVQHALLPDPDGFRARNAEMARRYDEGTVSPAEFCGFYVSTLGGRTPAFWQPWLVRFVEDAVLPHLPRAACELVERHRAQGDTLVLTTATNRVITEPTARHLGFAHVIATEAELGDDGRFSGRPSGVLNMRDGKVTRALEWLRQQGLPEAALRDAVFYSDSFNDLPLLSAVGRPVAVNPDARLRAEAQRRGWQILGLS